MVYNKPGSPTEHTDTVIDADFRLRPERYLYPTVRGRCPETENRRYWCYMRVVELSASIHKFAKAQVHDLKYVIPSKNWKEKMLAFYYFKFSMTYFNLKTWNKKIESLSIKIWHKIKTCASFNESAPICSYNYICIRYC